MSVIIRDLDQTRIHYEAALHRVGNKMANKAFSRALNREGRSATSKIKDALVEQTGNKKSTVSAALKIHHASANSMRYVITATGNHLTLHHFGLRRTKKGVSAQPWGNRRIFEGAFMLEVTSKKDKAEGKKAKFNAFVREGKGRYPYRVMFGPNIPKEMVEGLSYKVFEDAQPRILKEATRQLDLLLAGKIK